LGPEKDSWGGVNGAPAAAGAGKAPMALLKATHTAALRIVNLAGGLTR